MRDKKNGKIELAPIMKRSIFLLDAQESQTVIHCSYAAPDFYQNGGWININPETFLINQKEGGRLKLIYHERIPLFPIRHYFHNSGETLNFSLIFEGIPKSWENFSLLEKTAWGDKIWLQNIQKNNSGIYKATLSIS